MMPEFIKASTTPNEMNGPEAKVVHCSSTFYFILNIGALSLSPKHQGNIFQNVGFTRRLPKLFPPSACDSRQLTNPQLCVASCGCFVAGAMWPYLFAYLKQLLP